MDTRNQSIIQSSRFQSTNLYCKPLLTFINLQPIKSIINVQWEMLKKLSTIKRKKPFLRYEKFIASKLSFIFSNGILNDFLNLVHRNSTEGTEISFWLLWFSLYIHIIGMIRRIFFYKQWTTDCVPDYHMRRTSEEKNAAKEKVSLNICLISFRINRSMRNFILVVEFVFSAFFSYFHKFFNWNKSFTKKN